MGIQFEIGNVHTEATGVPPQMIEIFRYYMRYSADDQAMGAQNSGWVNPDAAYGAVWDGYIYCVETLGPNSVRFPTGLWYLAEWACKHWIVPFGVVDTRIRPEDGLPAAYENLATRPYQEKAVTAAIEHGRGVIDASPRCHDPKDLIMLSTGESIRADRVSVGTWLMGPNGSPRRVLETSTSEQTVYDVELDDGQKMRISGGHILMVADSPTAPLKPVEAWAVFQDFETRWMETSAVVTFQDSPEWLPVVPRVSPALAATIVFASRTLPRSLKSAFLVGLRGREISPDLRGQLIAPALGFRETSAGNYVVDRCPLALKISLGLKATKHRELPAFYQRGSAKDRRAFLVTAIACRAKNPNGDSAVFHLASEHLARGLIFLARSLGFSARKVKRSTGETVVTIAGPFSTLGDLPFDLADTRSAHRQRFTMQRPTEKKTRVVGWTVDVDNLYLTDGFVVTHNSGKTRMGQEIHRRISLPTLWVAPTTNIVEQTVNSFTEHFGKNYAEQIKGSKGWRKQKHLQVSVCTYKTAAVLPTEFYQRHEVLVFDEFHHAASRTIQTISEKAEHMFYRFGLTGTHYRSGSDRMAMDGVLSRVLASINPQDLIDGGYLVPADVLFVPSGGDRIPSDTDPQSVVSLGVWNNDGRNASVSWCASTLAHYGRKVVVLVGTKAQSRFVEDQIGEYMDPARIAVVNTDVHAKTCSKRISDFVHTTRYQVIIGTSMIGEGTDLPDADALVYAPGGKAQVGLVQAAYRICTASEGKPSRSILVDFTDRHTSSAKRHAETRLKIFYDSPVFTCHVLDDLEELASFARAQPMPAPI